jgi:phospholipid/cholesterol/gamma-HCH transport system ATP-binding protein
MAEQLEKIIQVKNLTGGYGETVILKDITFDVHQGEVFIILGGSGCGKSTMLKFMIGLARPFSGEIYVDGIQIVDASEVDYNKALRSFGVMYQNGALFGSMNLMENICLVLEEFTDLPRSAMESIAQMRLNQVGLGECENGPRLLARWHWIQKSCFSMNPRPVWIRLPRPRWMN